MNSLPLFCSKLSQNVNQILDLIGAESKIQQKDILKVEASLKKAIAFYNREVIYKYKKMAIAKIAIDVKIFGRQNQTKRKQDL